MTLRHKDPFIPSEPGTDAFENCKLERKKYAEVLTDIVSSYADGFVLAINNPWGEGKSTFVKMWRQQLINQEFKTLYFNAWENDFQEDVLIALLAELEVLRDSEDESKFKSVLEKATPLVKNVGVGLLKGLSKKIGADEVVQAMIDGTIDAALDGLEHEITSYTSRKKGIEDFKQSLEKFISTVDQDKPVVFFIDELDRCRPNYAVKILEQIKHLFSVPGIVVVLSIDKEQLGHAVKGVYGSEGINADEYLRRFIDLEYSIPRPNVQMYIEYLYEYFKFDEFLWSTERGDYPDFKHDKGAIIILSQLFFSRGNFTLRQIEKVFSKIRVTLKGFMKSQYVFPEIIVFIGYLSLKNPEFLDKVRIGTYSLQKFVDELESILLPFADFTNHKQIVNLFASCLCRYSNEFLEGKAGNNERLITTSIESYDEQLGFKSQLDDNFGNVLNAIKYYTNQHRTYDVKLNYILNKYDLLETIKS